MNPANFAELKSKIDTWDISAEELLLQKMKIFTINYNEEFQQFCKNMDNFANHIESLEVEHLKAINKIKTIARDKFIENALNKGEESESESCSNENNLTPTTPNEIQITNVEIMKPAIDISLNCLEEINRKNKNKEEIEDDAVSVASSKIMMDKGAKIRLPMIIGTEEFKADKAIGLNVAPIEDDDDNLERKQNEEEEYEEDSDVEELLQDINTNIDQKQKQKWDKIRGKKIKKLKKKREKERQKLAATKTFAPNGPKINEPEVKVPIENEGDPNTLGVTSADPSKSGGAVPPPPPPPPAPPERETIHKSKNKDLINNPYAQDALNRQANVNQNSALNPEMNIQNINQQQPQEQKPGDFQEMLRNRYKTIANPNQNPDINQNNIEGKAPTSVTDLLHTDADNKNPLAPVIRDNIVLTKQNVNIAAFLKTSDFLGGQYDDEDDDYDDISGSIFKRRPTQQPKNPQSIIQPQMQMPQINQNIIENQPQINQPQINQNQEKPMMIMGMPRPQPQEQIPQQNQNQQMPMEQISMIKPFQNQNETKAIEIKKNRELENARNKLKNMFESDDEDEMDSITIVDKTKDITEKVNLFAQQNQNNEKKENKFNMFDEGPKQNENKPKFSFLDENDNDQDKKNITLNNNININVNTNINANLNLEQEKPKPKLNLFDNLGNNTTVANENKIIADVPKPKPKLSFFDEDENAEPINQKPKLSFFNEKEKKEPIQATNSNPESQNTKPQPSFLANLRDKIGQNINEIKKEPEPINQQIEAQNNLPQQAKIEEPNLEKPKILENPSQEQQFQPRIIMPKPENENKPKIGLFDISQPQVQAQPRIIMPRPEIENKPQIQAQVQAQPQIIMPKPEIEIKPQIQPKVQEQPQIIMPKPEIQNKPKIGLFDIPAQKPQVQINPQENQQKEEIKNKELPIDEKKKEDISAKPAPRKSNPNTKFAAMQNMLANKMGQRGGMMMMMGGPPPKREEVKIEHDENVSERGTGENNYEAVVKKTSVVKKKKPKKSGAFSDDTNAPIKTVPKKVEKKQQIKIDNKKEEVKPKVDLFNVQIEKPKVDFFNNQPENPPEVKPKVDLFNVQIEKPKVDFFNNQPENPPEVKPKADLFNVQIEKPKVDFFNNQPENPPDGNPPEVKPKQDLFNFELEKPKVDLFNAQMENPSDVKLKVDLFNVQAENPQEVKPKADLFNVQIENPPEVKPKVDLFNVEIEKPKVDLFNTQAENPPEVKPKVDLFNVEIEKPKVDLFNTHAENPPEVKPKVDLFNVEIEKPKVDLFNTQTENKQEESKPKVDFFNVEEKKEVLNPIESQLPQQTYNNPNTFIQEEKKEEYKPSANLFFQQEEKREEPKPVTNIFFQEEKTESKPVNNLFFQENQTQEVKPANNIFFEEKPPKPQLNLDFLDTKKEQTIPKQMPNLFFLEDDNASKPKSNLDFLNDQHDEAPKTQTTNLFFNNDSNTNTTENKPASNLFFGNDGNSSNTNQNKLDFLMDNEKKKKEEDSKKKLSFLYDDDD